MDATHLLRSADVWSVIASFQIHVASLALKVETDAFLVGVLVRAWVCFQYSAISFFVPRDRSIKLNDFIVIVELY